MSQIGPLPVLLALSTAAAGCHGVPVALEHPRPPASAEQGYSPTPATCEVSRQPARLRLTARVDPGQPPAGSSPDDPELPPDATDPAEQRPPPPTLAQVRRLKRAHVGMHAGAGVGAAVGLAGIVTAVVGALRMGDARADIMSGALEREALAEAHDRRDAATRLVGVGLGLTFVGMLTAAILLPLAQRRLAAYRQAREAWIGVEPTIGRGRMGLGVSLRF